MRRDADTDGKKNLFGAENSIKICSCLSISRALADILRQQGPIPISQYDCENFAAMNGSPKDNTPVRTSSKNHYTPVHTSKSNHGKSSSFLPLKHSKLWSLHKHLLVYVSWLLVKYSLKADFNRSTVCPHSSQCVYLWYIHYCLFCIPLQRAPTVLPLSAV